MLFLLSKLVSIFLKPMVWTILCILFSFLTKREKRKKRLLCLGISILFIFSNPALINIVMSLHEGQIKPLGSLKGTYDYAIVLGGFSNLNYANDTPYTMNERGNRLMTTLELYNKGIAKKILISGGSGEVWNKSDSEAIVVRRFLINLGLPEEDIVIEPKSKNTYENAKFTKEILDQIQPNSNNILVTSAFHMPRAQRLFAKQGVSFDTYPTDFIKRPLNRPDHIFIPSAKAMWTWELIIKEWVGMITYKLAGKL